MLKKAAILSLTVITIALALALGSCGDAVFQASNLTITPASATAGQTVEVSIDIANTGGAAGTVDAILLVNGGEESRQTLALEAGESGTVTFPLSRDIAGEYRIELGGLSGQLAIVDLDEIMSRAARAMAELDSYHFNCTVGIEIPLPEDVSLFE
jgi:hypothetical protein